MKLVSTMFTDLVPMEQFIKTDGNHTLPYVFDGIAPMAQDL